MSPKRRTKDTDLPACVYRRHGAYWLVKRGKWRRLGADLKSALAAYAFAVEAPAGGMAALIDEAMSESIEPSVKPSTRKKYQDYALRLKKILAEFEPHQVTQADIASIKRSLRKRPGVWNHCLALLRRVFDYGLEHEMVMSNPAIAVKRLTQKPRTRLISPGEYSAIYEGAPARLQILMDLMFGSGQRPMDVVRLKRVEFRSEGIYFRQQKTDKPMIVAWTPQLRAVAERAKSLYGPNVESMTVFRTRHGTVPAYKTIYDMWRRACKKAGVEDAQLRDLRAMSATAAKRQGKNPTKLLGHSSPQTTERYLRGKEVPIVEGPGIGQAEEVVGQAEAK